MPTIFRLEIIHPLIVHFPVALLITAALLKLVSYVPADLVQKRAPALENTIMTLTGIGSLMAWAAYISGDAAADIVIKNLCNPAAIDLHEAMALTAAIMFSTAFAIGLVKLCTPGIKASYLKQIGLLFTLLLFVGAGFIGYAGHLGAELVYSQGAAVYKASVDCHEFGR